MNKKYGFKNKNFKQRGMQRIKTVRWPARNIGGDRAFTKLFYVTGATFNILAGNSAVVNQMAFGVGAADANPSTITGVLGSTPGLSTLALQYTRYRIRGIKLKLTYWQQSGPPVILFANAQTDQAEITPVSTGPTPGFPNPTINILPEQRWAKYRTCQMTQAGGRATTLNVYYSVDKVFGPDQITRNDEDFTGELRVTAPYFAEYPIRSPWLEIGLCTLSGDDVAAGSEVTGVLKLEATVYTTFFGKRVSIE